ncbi:hypothetical protein GPALN_014596 [Globodera pallida]|nr:hypothetical protein GPALN_014596 [Globodera pallida]
MIGIWKRVVFGEIFLLRLCREGNLDKVQYIVSAGGQDLEESNSAGQTALIVSAYFGRTEIVRFLLSYGRTENTDINGCSALCCACSRGHLAVCKVLIANGADVNRESLAGGHPMERGQNVEACNSRGQTALMYSAYFGQMNVVTYLLAKGARRDRRNGRTAEDEAQARGHRAIVERKMVLPLYLLKTAHNHPMLIELKNGDF